MIPNRHQRRHPEMYGLTLYAPDDDTPAGGGSNVAVMDKPAEAEEGETPDESASADEDEPDEAARLAAEADKQPEIKLDPEMQALKDASYQEGLLAGETKREQTDREAAEAKAASDKLEALKNLRTKRNEEIANTPVKHTDADGNEVTSKLSEFAIGQAVLATLVKNDADLEEHFGLGFRETQDANMLALLPADAHDATQKALDEAADYKAHAQAFGEAYAPHAKAIKELELEDLVKLSPKANTQHKAHLAAEKKTWRTYYQDHPDELGPEGEPVIGGGIPGGPDMTYERFLKLKEPDKAKWADANPAKFAEFIGIGKGK